MKFQIECIFVIKYFRGKIGIVIAIIKIKYIFRFYKTVKYIQGTSHLYKAGHFPVTLKYQ